jgi:carboxyl-terminal processing protease
MFFAFPAYSQSDERTAGSSEKVDIKKSSDTYRQLSLFGEVFESVREKYVEEVADEELIKTAINGMLISLDPHSSYLDEKDFEEMQVQTRGEFGGLGIEVTMESGVVKVVSPIDDTPAFRAGVKAGDYITHLDGEQIMGLSLNEAVEKMRGKVGTPIVITVRRKGNSEALEITIIRDIIKLKAVKHDVYEDSVGYVRVTTFNKNTTSGLKKAIKEIKKELGDNLRGFVLDLRNNPGGLLEEAISVSDLFLDKGEIVSTRGRNKSDTKRDNATKGDITEDLPMVVLINGGSASASEIVAGALQDHGRAIIMGTKSFGKGSVQTIMPLPGHGAMRLTTARYYTPSGKSIQATGIDPDIEVELAKIETFEVKERSEADLRGALENPNGDNKPNEEAENSDEGDDKEIKDYQLSRAIDLIRGVSLYEERFTRTQN